ncbi:hypothetical protein A9Z63_03140 [Moraxella lacunata]|uniref:NAD-dependent epimerase/dehydratase domain-containing protein n=5 Tax=Moraxellaceae TaxID=468 RepID=A0A1B8PZH5_MORLA|nr:NAD-dependent epimerase/dehydratase family protein [Moraxella lacunata]OBX61892.1 hypothetical protein A9309_07650 [Moraxella lacunata]OBX64658.1 hypothetical protein A9Z63_03140 [Moraxella lacunata]
MGGQKNKYLIIGQGFVGKAVAQMLSQAGHDVTGLARTAKSYDEPVHFWQRDARTLAQDELAPFSHVAIIITPNHEMTNRVQAYRESYLAVCEHIASLDLPNLHRVLFVSSTSVYGESGGEWVDIDTIACPATDTAKILLKSEQVLQKAFGERCVIVRPSGIYHGGSTRMKRMAQTAHIDGVPLSHYTNRIHRDDLIQVISQVLTLPASKSVYLVSDCEPVTSLEVIRFLCRNYGYLPPKVIHATPTGKRIRGNVDDWLVFKNYQMGYGVDYLFHSHLTW